MTSVLISGAGPVGLALAADLGWRGVPCVVLEQSDGAIAQPKMLTVGARTMEYCRRWGIAREVRAAAIPADYPRESLYATSLAGKEILRFTAPGPDGASWPWGPEPRERCAQTRFDPILRRFASAQPGIEVRHGMKVVALEQDASGVRLRIERAGGGTETLEATRVKDCPPLTGAAFTQ